MWSAQRTTSTPCARSDVSDAAAVWRATDSRGSDATQPFSSRMSMRLPLEMTSGFPDDAPWTPPELAPNLVRRLATGTYDALAGRYIHAEHDDVDDLLARIDDIREHDLNTIRLRR